MAKLTGQTIASSYDQLLIVTDSNGVTSTLQAVESADTGGAVSSLQISTVGAAIDNPTASSATQGGKLTLFSDDGAALGDTHRLGVLEFSAAEDASSTITIGARIEAIADAAWSASENGADMVFYTTDGNASQAEVMRLTADNDVQVSTGNLVIGTAGKGISFAATSDGGVTTPSELLDDYEEGTWTPAAQNYDGTEVLADAVYTRVGRVVHLTAKITGDGTADANHFVITGLPFAAAQIQPVSIISNGDYSGQQGFVQGEVESSVLAMYESDGTDMTYTMMGFDSSKYVRFSATYFV